MIKEKEYLTKQSNLNKMFKKVKRDSKKATINNPKDLAAFF